MTEDRRYNQFLDEFGARLRHAAANEAAGHRRLASVAAVLAGTRRSIRVRILVASMVCAGAVAVVVLVVVPGSGSSGYLARAAAAITPPGPETVLYESWEATRPAEGPGYPSRTFGPDQLWIEESAPRHYRQIMQPRPGAGTASGADLWGEYGGIIGFGGYPYWLAELEAAVAGHPLEIGGELENPDEHAQPPRTFTFTPPNTLWSGRFRAPVGAPLPEAGHVNEAVADPVVVLRQAISEGRAHEAGTSEFDGKTVERITFNPPTPSVDAPRLPPDRRYALIEAETFKPVEFVFGHLTYRLLAYEYLPANPANLALANIQAQHPDANVIADTPPSKSTSEGSAASGSVAPK